MLTGLTGATAEPPINVFERAIQLNGCVSECARMRGMAQGKDAVSQRAVGEGEVTKNEEIGSVSAGVIGGKDPYSVGFHNEC
jgi:hypothetical protein